jgi:ribosomal-protein-alanine N-acetyltransferase
MRKTRLAFTESSLRSRKLVLEPIQPAHARALFSSLQAPDLYAFIPHSPPNSVAELEEKYRRWANGRSADGTEVWLNYAVYFPDRAVYVGTVQATIHKSGQCYIAYEVFPAYWRRGFGKEACETMIAHIFSVYNVEAISALVDTRNEASQRLLMSLAFRRTGKIEHADEFKGSVSDEYRYELRRVEWLVRCG